MGQLLTDSLLHGEDIKRLNLCTGEQLEGIPSVVLCARCGILGHLVLGISGQYEQRIHEGVEKLAGWRLATSYPIPV